MVERVLQFNKERIIFLTLVGALFISMCFYIYYINITVHNVVARQNLENEASQLTLSIGNKEFEYISMRNAIDLSLAQSLGFRETAVRTYISAQSQDSIAILPR
ncbi:MAG: hypothetical protein WAX44_03780 [Minisyncoccia bacterium]